ncbi:flavin-containing monooxygenase [Mesonia sediminis]|uniref:Flavin-containing monooxygenase n=1 Tax=Mesonia sediminis TaxID=1703946 RepID=A0ABW5SGI3_9FLAO
MKDFIIVGAAQAGLAMAYYLQQNNQSFLMVDKESEIGASWLNRWDSLKLFTPTEFNHLPGLDFPAPKGHYPNKYEVAEYFKTYANHFNFPIELNTLIQKIYKKDEIFHLKHNNGIYQAKNVIIATGPFHIPYTPPCAKKISNEICQMHSNYYQNPKQLKAGNALVVGDGDSGFQILDEISKQSQHTVYFSGETNIKSLPQEILGKTLWWWFTKTGFLSFSKNSFIGKRISSNRQPVIGTNVKEILNRENVIPVGRTTDADGKRIETELKTLEDVKNIVWATGYRPNFEWIEGLELTHEGYPKHHRGVSTMKGLYFIGLPWLHTRGSATLGGIKKDAAYLVKKIQKKQ